MRPKFLDVDIKSVSYSHAFFLSIFLVFMLCIYLFADLFDYTIRIIGSIILAICFLFLAPFDLFKSNEKK